MSKSSLTQVLVLYVPPWLPVELRHVMTLLCEVLNEHFLHITVSAYYRRNKDEKAGGGGQVSRVVLQ